MVGAVGFVVDGAILVALVDGAGWPRTWSRIPSFLVAVTVTWRLHRHFTFTHARRAPPSVREWARFALANAFGNGLNLALYWALVVAADFRVLPALALASAVAFGVNYAASARWVFRARR